MTTYGHPIILLLAPHSSFWDVGIFLKLFISFLVIYSRVGPIVWRKWIPQFYLTGLILIEFHVWIHQSIALKMLFQKSFVINSIGVRVWPQMNLNGGGTARSNRLRGRFSWISSRTRLSITFKPRAKLYSVQRAIERYKIIWHLLKNF